MVFQGALSLKTAANKRSILADYENSLRIPVSDDETIHVFFDYPVTEPFVKSFSNGPYTLLELLILILKTYHELDEGKLLPLDLKYHHLSDLILVEISFNREKNYFELHVDS
jgi:hypothetical protein